MRLATSTYRLCYAGQDLYQQVMAAYPNRDIASDGWVGDASHAARESDHNVNWSWTPGIVKALDLDKDLGGGADFNSMVERVRLLARAGDRRFRGGYIIWRGRICSSVDNWAWRYYDGENRHDHHAHFSFGDAKADFDARGTFPVKVATAPPQLPAPYGRTPAGDRVLGMHNPALTGPDVTGVQNALRVAGNYGLAIDGMYGRATADLINVFKSNRGINELGCGALTWAALRRVVHG